MAVAFSLEPIGLADEAFRYEVYEATIKPYIDQIVGLARIEAAENDP